MNLKQVKKELKQKGNSSTENKVITGAIEYCIRKLKKDISEPHALQIIESLNQSDIERIFVIPCTVFVSTIDINQKHYEEAKGKWYDALYILLLIWLKIDEFDDQFDKQHNQDTELTSQISEESLTSDSFNELIPSSQSANLQLLMRSYKVYTETAFDTFESYTSGLFDRYSMYGEYLVNSVNRIIGVGIEAQKIDSADDLSLNHLNLSAKLTGILVIQQMNDDAADWLEDIIQNKHTWITYHLKKRFPELSQGREVDFVHKEYFVFHLHPQFSKELNRYREECENTKLVDVILDERLNEYLAA